MKDQTLPPPPAFSICPKGCDGFKAILHIEEMIQLEMPKGQELPEGSMASAPGDVVAVVTVHHDGVLEIEQVASPWTFKTLGHLAELGSLFFKARELAEQMIGPNWTAAKKIEVVRV